MSMILARTLSSRIITSSIKTRLLNKPLKTPLLQVQKRSMGDHSYMWVVERAVAVALIPLAPLTFFTPNAICDNTLALLFCAHGYWGCAGIVKDYIRPKIFGKIFPKVMLTIVTVLMASAFGGLLYFNQNDVGIGRAVRKFWDLQPAKS